MSFIWGKMRTEAQELALQIGLRNLQRGSEGRSLNKILVKGQFNAIKCLLYKRFSVSHKELMAP